MADPTITAFTFAGYLLAKSVSLLAGAPCEEVLVPIALMERSDHPEFVVFGAETQEQAVQRGLAAMKWRATDGRLLRTTVGQGLSRTAYARSTMEEAGNNLSVRNSFWSRG
jgi:hypothetical protein